MYMGILLVRVFRKLAYTEVMYRAGVEVEGHSSRAVRCGGDLWLQSQPRIPATALVSYPKIAPQPGLDTEDIRILHAHVHCTCTCTIHVLYMYVGHSGRQMVLVILTAGRGKHFLQFLYDFPS